MALTQNRGLDIPTVQLVLNYEVPANPADYIHRIGRTARAGRGGMSLSIVTEKDIDIVLNIESKISMFLFILIALDKKLVEYSVPENAVLDLLNQVSLAKRVASMALLDGNFGQKVKLNRSKKLK